MTPGFRSKLGAVALWIPTVVLGLLFIAQGIMKLVPGSPWSSMFEAWGYPGGSHLAVGVVELLAGLVLFIPRFASLAAGGLAVVMLGATGTHLVHGEFFNVKFTLALALIFFCIGWARRSSLRWSMSRVKPRDEESVPLR